MTPEQLAACTGARMDRAEAFADLMTAAMNEFEITTPERIVAFLAQVGHESGGLHWMREIWGPTAQQLRYEPPSELAARLGNTKPGDGKRFMGHGLIQVTGRYNHARMRDRLRKRFPLLGVPDFEVEPEKLAAPQWATLSAADYWSDRGLNELADAGDFEAITRRINGGLTHLDQRVALWDAGKAHLGLA